MRVRVAALSELSLGSLTKVRVGDQDVCLARVADGEVRALLDPCPHEGYSLSGGELVGCAVECPMHASRFDLRTGAVTGLPATDPAMPVSVEIAAGEVYVEVPSTTSH